MAMTVVSTAGRGMTGVNQRAKLTETGRYVRNVTISRQVKPESGIVPTFTVD